MREVKSSSSRRGGQRAEPAASLPSSCQSLCFGQEGLLPEFAQEQKRFNFIQFPEDRRWRAARAALAPCALWKGNVSSCREPSGNLCWQISSCLGRGFTLFAGSFVMETCCFESGLGLCVTATFTLLPNYLFWSLCLILALFLRVDVCLQQAAFSGCSERQGVSGEFARVCVLRRFGPFLPFLMKFRA